MTLPAGVRLDKFLNDALSQRGEEISRSRLQRLIEEGGVSGIDAAKIKAAFKAKTPVEISVTLPGDKDIRLKPAAIDIPILYEDDYLAIVHKPAGMTVHPGAGTGDDTLVHALIANVGKLSPHAERPGIVHRLDRETEGLMVIAKTEKARAALSHAFAEREISKVYQALIWGKVSLPEEVSGFIWRDVHDRKKMRFAMQVPERVTRARDAELIVAEQKQFKFATRLTISLITGRTHQIRATAAFFNAPVIGDTVYGNDDTRAKLYKIGREKRDLLAGCGMLLMAREIAFKHPFKRKTMEFALPVPARFTDAEKALS